VVEIVRRLFVLFPAHTTIERIEGYVELLGDFRAQDVAAGCEALAKRWTDSFVPPVGKVREAAQEARAARLRTERSQVPQLEMGDVPDGLELRSKVWTKLRRVLGRIPTEEEVDHALG
jgi:hypothetical protein